MADLWGGRCDLCHAELPIGKICYTYFTPSTGTEAEALAGKAFWAEDPEWGVCEDCHLGLELLAGGVIDRSAWLMKQAEKSLANQPYIVIGMPQNELVELRQAEIDETLRILSGFIANKIPEYTREINEGVPRESG